MEVQGRTYRRTRKRAAKEKTESVDILFDLSAGVCRDQIVKLHSCQPHIAVHPQENQKGTSIQEAEDRSEGLVFPYLLGGFPRRQRSKRRVNHKNETKAQNADFHGDQIMKNIANQPLPAARRCALKKRKCRQKVDETSDPEVVYPSLGRERSKRRVSCEKGITPQQGKLDTNTFESYLETLWRSFGDEKRNLFTYLDCLWFSLYTKESSKANVLNWIKKKHIFSKNTSLFPLSGGRCHWSLLIFCHFGESLQSKSRPPCMLLLDSLQMANPKRLEPGIRKFVLDIYKAEERSENKEQIYRIPLKVPKVPQQRNGEECGNFVLYYIKLFTESAPENFSINEGYPYFMKEDWFTPEGLECFCKRLDSSCQ